MTSEKGRVWAVLASVVVATTALAGCTGGEDDGDEPPADDVTIGTVSITKAPDSGTPGEKITVCWRVTGSGTVPHVAVHFDTESHPTSTSFTDYQGGAAYPDNTTAEDPAGYTLGDTYCTALTLPQSGALYYRGHAMTTAPGKLSSEDSTSVRAVPPSPGGMNGVVIATRVTRANDTADAGMPTIVCWRADGTGTVAHVSVHWDIESHPATAPVTDYHGGAINPDNATALDPEGYELPGEWCSNLPMPSHGTVYARAHVIDSTGTARLDTQETMILQTVAFEEVPEIPETAPAGSAVTVCWRVNSSGHVPHIAVHWDSETHPDGSTFAAYDGGVMYPDNQTAPASAGYDTPGRFCTDITMPASGTMYFRAHVMDTAPGHVSGERSIAVG